ncbi:MFS transporter [SCandidatus Aminicenantes bacterium Aminicenantia_JdfR_composite]|nr:MFS transporter [SCandidatus Aminicenantes bacterium Aminicenantia_JdfR_composite]MCP2597230.1 MFS transporter [Candidatus Aminicenantes bacterium AC-335-G13]MCP2597728.1 MFS transporter [Candidatus Aminicenantes bacterium AC-335-L06]MCP2620895.1 MFS transporter [Candidatus Aminicenantes bacterium AC-334-E05]
MKKKIPSNVKFLGLVSFFNDSASEMIYPLLPVFLTSYLGTGTAIVGLIEGIAESISSLSKLISGWLSDLWKKRKVIVIGGYALSSLSRPIIGITTNWTQVLTLRFADRLGKGIRTSPRDALLVDSVNEKERGRAFGFQRAFDHLGAVVGPVIAFLLLRGFHLSLRTVFLLAILPSILILTFLIFFVREKIPLITQRGKLNLREVKFSSAFKYYLATLIIFTLGNSSDAFLILKAKEAGITIGFLPLIWMGHNFVKAISAYPSGVLSDKFGRKKIIIFGWLVYSLVYIGFAFSNKYISIILLFLLYGLVFGTTEAVEKAFVADLVPEKIRATGYGVFNFVVGVTLFPASMITGILWQKFSSKVALLTGAILAFIACLMLNGLKEKQLEEKQNESNYRIN